MPAIIDYILKLNICFAVVYLFYQLFLRKLTFYNWNRWYLLGYTALSFIIPLVDIMPSLQKRAPETVSVVQWIPAISFQQPAEQSFFDTLSYWDRGLAILMLGAFLLLIRFLVRFMSFQKMKAKARLISEGDTNIYQVDGNARPFSFGNAIFINTEMHGGEELEEIIRHEFVHVKQKHTIDILWCELLCILNWFNPFVWALRHNVKQNLEFIADNQVLQNGIDKKEYQYLLLKVMGNRQFTFTNHFNFSSLKKRIAMMNTLKSARIHMVKFMFLLPVVAVLLLSFRKEVIKLQEKQTISEEKRGDNPGGRLPEKFVTMEKEQPTVAVTPSLKKDTLPAEKKKVAIALRGNPDSDSNPLIVIDGVVMGSNHSLNTVNVDDIESFTILKDENASAIYGERAKDGVILVTTKDGVKRNRSIIKGMEGKNPKYVLNGKPIESIALIDLDPKDIQSISVLKGESAKSLYGADASDGVILITTMKVSNDSIRFSPKDDKADTILFSSQEPSKTDEVFVGYGTKNISSELKGKVTGVQIRSTDEVVVTGYGIKPERPQLKGQAAGVVVKPNKTDEVAEVKYGRLREAEQGNNGFRITGRSELPAGAYYVLNGEKVKKKEIDRLKPNVIKSVNVLKGESAVTFYGKKAKDGAVVITTK